MPTTIVIAGTYTNSGTIQLTPDDTIGIGDSSTADATLTGGGTVALVDSTSIDPAVPSSVLTNEDNLIEGGGGTATPASINVTLINGAAGTVSAVGNDGASEVILDLNADVTNDGALSATHAGTLVLNGVTIDNSGGGTVSATDTGSEVLITAGATILGGTLTSDAGADIRLAGGVLDGTGGHTVENGGDVVIGAGETGTLVGIIDNFGTITLESPGATLAIGADADPTAELEGFGLVELGASTSIVAGTADATLVNVDNLIEATGGTVGDTDGAIISVAVENQFNGVISAEGDGAGHGVLTITGDVANAGILDAEGGGQLILSGIEIDQSMGGAIAAGYFCSCAPSEVVVENSTILGGALFSGPDSIIEVTDSVLKGTDDVGPIFISADIEVAAFHSMTLAGRIINGGDITLDAAATLIVDDTGPVTLVGGGTIELTESGVVEGAGPGARLDNISNAIIASGGDAVAGTDGNSITVDLVNIELGLIGAIGDSAGHGLLSLTGATTNLGVLLASDTGKLVIGGALHNLGETVADGGTIFVNGDVSGGAGQFILTADGELDIAATTDGIATFLGDGGSIHLAQADDFVGVWSGAAGSFDLEDVPAPAAPDSYSLRYDVNDTGTGGVLTLSDGASDLWSVRVAGQYTVADFTFGDDGNGGTLVSGGTVTSTAWQGGVGGQWSNPARWDAGVPGTWSDALLLGGPYTVQVSTDQTVYAIETGFGVTLRITGGNFWANGGTGAGVSVGTIAVSGGASFNVAGNFQNFGLLKLAGANATLRLHATHIDGGTIRAVADSVIEAAVYASVLNDVSVIGQTNASGSSRIRATLGGSITVLGGQILSSRLSASGAAGIGGAEASSIAFGDTLVQNSLLTGAGIFETVAFANAFFQGVTVAHGSSFDVVGNSILELHGLFTNDGSVDVDAAGSVELLGNVRLDGVGTLELHDSTIASVDSATSRLVNDSVILGSGRVGDEDMTLVTNTMIAAFGDLVIDTGAHTITNNGIMKAFDHSTLTVLSRVLNNYTLSTAGTGASLVLADVFNDGTILNEVSGSVSQTGSLVNRDTGIVTNHGDYDLHSTLANYGSVDSLEGFFTVDGLFSNSGSLEVDAGSFEADGRTTNKGTITAGASSDVTHGDVVINTDTGVITNSGSYTVAATLINGGLIESLGGSFTASAGVSNRASIEAENGASFVIVGTLGNSGGTLLVDDSFMSVQSAALGGTASIANGGTLEFGTTSTVDVAFDEDPNVLVLDQSTKFSGDLADFTTGNLVAFMDMAASDSIHFSYAANAGDTGGLLSVFDTTALLTARIHIDGAGYTTSDFVASTYNSPIDGSSRFAVLSQHPVV